MEWTIENAGEGLEFLGPKAREKVMAARLASRPDTCPEGCIPQGCDRPQVQPELDKGLHGIYGGVAFIHDDWQAAFFCCEPTAAGIELVGTMPTDDK